jgi:hypothetical protein
MPHFTDSYLNIYHGPIRGGKTASMTGDVIIDMINGRRCFSNYKIEFRYKGKDYSAEPLIADELLYIDRDDIKKKYNDCVIAWDEGALSMPARDFQSAQNKLTSQAMLLRGKLQSSIYFCVQYLSMFEKNMRLQEDTLIFCHDLSFKYKNLERGAFISQAFQDISGRSTGYTYEESGRVYRQRFFAKLVWPVYDTLFMPEKIVKDKIGIKDVRAVLNGSEFEKEDYDNFSSYEENESVVDNLLRELDAMEQKLIPSNTMKLMASKRGFHGDNNELIEILINKGVQQNTRGQWNLRNVFAMA